MKKVLLLLLCIVAYTNAYCETPTSEFAQNLEAIARLAWPVSVLILFIILYPQIKNILNSKKICVKVAGIELNINEVTTQLTTHVLDLEKKLMELKCEMDDANGKELPVIPGIKSKGWRILWVTENHAYHAMEIAFLERDGVEVIKANSTKEAMDILKEEADSIDAIITGISRKENHIDNPKAGFDLLRKVKNAGYPTEVFVMCSPNNIRQYYDQLKAAGAKEATSSPLALLSFLKGAGLNCPRQQKALEKKKDGKLPASTFA